MIPTRMPGKLRRGLIRQADQPATVGQVKPYDAHLLDDRGQAAAVIEAGGFWAWQGRGDSSRIIAWARPYEAAAILEYVRAARDGCDSRREAWRYNSLTELHGGLSRLLAASDLRAIDYY